MQLLFILINKYTLKIKFKMYKIIKKTNKSNFFKDNISIKT